MKQALKPFAIGLGILWLAWVMALLYGVVAPRLLGPEKEINALHGTISPGISVVELRTLLKPDINVTTAPNNADNALHISKLTGDWLCTFKVRLQNEKVHTVKNVICVD
ncbi:MAG: hypothetical protein AAFP03_01245 [Cyanobacteria bacterium J06598_3]